MTLLTRYRGTLSVAFAIAAGAAFLAPSARAQDPKPAAPPKPADNSQPAPAAPPAGKIDPDAKKAIDQMAAAHQAIKTFSGKMVVFQKQGGQAEETTTIFSFARPNKVNVTTTAGPTGRYKSTVVSDGKQVYATNSEDTASYIKVDALPDERNIARAMRQSGGGGTPLFWILLTNPKASDAVLGPNVTSLEFQPDSKVAGVDVKVVKTVLSFPNQTVVATFSIGKGDSLLHAVSLAPVAATAEQSVLVTETYSDIKVNPTLADSTFTFTPAPGAKEQKPAPVSAPGNPAPAKP
jgi:outer membrane lipoprotein-sorting protein